MNIGKILSLVFIVYSLNATGLVAGEALSLSLEQALGMALKNNRDLKIAALEIERVKSRLRWSGRLANPQLVINGSNDFVGQDEGESQFSLSFNQKFPLTSRLKKEKNVRRVEVLLAEAELAENRRSVAYMVHVILVKLLTGKVEGESHKRLIKLNEDITDSLQTRARAGEASTLDVTQLKLNGRLLVREDMVHDAGMRRLSLELKKHLYVETSQSVILTGELKLPESKPGDKFELADVLQNRPDFLMSKIRTEVNRADLNLQKAKTWEDVGVQIFARSENEIDEPYGLERNTFLGFGLSIPLPFRNRNQQGVELANINIEASERTTEASKFAIKNDLVSALSDRSAAWTLASETLGRDVRLARENLKDFEKAYRNGQVDIIQVERAQEQLTELENTAVKLQREYHLADALVRYVRGDYPNLRIPDVSQTK